MSDNNRVSGTVKWFNAERGYGFVFEDGDGETEYFVHQSYIDMDGYKTLKAGQAVAFDITETDKGIQAHNVMPAI